MRALSLVVLAGCGRFAFDAHGEQDSDAAIDARIHAYRSLLKTTGVAQDVMIPDYPLLVVLDDVRADRASMQNNASDLRFFSPNGDSLAYEIEQVGVPGGAPLLAWVRVPTLTSTTKIYVDYGHPPVDAIPPGVWDARYEAVWHLSDPMLRDASGHGHGGIPHGTQQRAGAIGGGRAFGAANFESIEVSDAPGLGLAHYTISGWMRISAPTMFAVMLSRHIQNTDSSDFYLGANSGNLYSITSTTTVQEVKSSTNAPLTVGAWRYITSTYDGTTMRTYLDATEIDATPIGGSVLHSATPIFLGGECSGFCSVANADFLDGVLDEVRLEHEARPQAWIATDFTAMKDLLITYGSVMP